MNARTISLSTDVFAKIWSLRKPGEDSEDAILRRLLECGAAPASSGQTTEAVGFYSKRFNVRFSEGFEIFRTFKGKDYRARATQGRWRLHGDNRVFDSLSELSGAIGTSIENVWVNWFFLADDGERRPIAVLRDPANVSRRTK